MNILDGLRVQYLGSRAISFGKHLAERALAICWHRLSPAQAEIRNLIGHHADNLALTDSWDA